jgi:penicillin-binding protein 2
VNERSVRRLFVLRMIVVSLLLTLSGRLWFLQVLSSGRYVAAASENGVRQIVTPATRGQILDDRGVPLVRNRTALVISVDRAGLPSGAAARDAELRRLAGVVGMSPDEVRQRITPCSGTVKPPCWNGAPYQPVPIRDDAGPDVALAITEHREDFPGISAELAGVREYPQTTLAAHSLGYLSPITEAELKDPRYRDYRSTDLIGRSGLEQTYDAALRGRPGTREVTVDHLGTVTGVVDNNTPPTPGNSLVLSLDAGVQRVAETALANAMTAARTRVDRDGVRYRAPTGAAVVLEAKTGRVIALASAPSFDPSVFVGGISTADYQALQDPAAGVPLLSRATQGQFAPGSTFKIVSTSAAVTDGASLRASYSCPPSFDVGGQSFKNFEGEALGTLSLHQALVKSCDTIFYQFGYNEWLADQARIKDKQPTIEPMVTMAKAFGFGRPTGIDLPGESAGLMVDRAYKLADWNARKADYCAGAQTRPKGSYQQRIDAENCADGYVYRGGDAVLFAVGQGDALVTPLQLAVGYATVANGGTVYAPQVAKAVISATGQVVSEFPARPVRQVPVDPATLAYIRAALADVTGPEGTAGGAYSGFPFETLKVAGKTGTAEVQGHQDTSWFASYAPANDPQYVVVGMVAEAGQGALTSAPMTREIWDGIYGLEGHPAMAPGGRLPATLPPVAPDGTVTPAMPTP